MIYLVSLGHDYEGRNVEKIFKSLESAEICVKDFIEEDIKNFTLLDPWVKINSKLWESGCRYLIIDEMELND